MVDKVNPNVLIVTDDTAAARSLLEAMAARSIRGTVARNVKAGLDHAQQHTWDLVVADLAGPGGDAFDVLHAVKQRDPELPVVMLSEEAAVEVAVRAAREGCEDFLVKPLSRKRIDRLLDALIPNREVALAEAAESDARCLYRICGASPKLIATLELARKVAPTCVPILICGETGTGKELVARAIHSASRRSDRPYLRVNCAAVTESLLESELFGHERGAFTGAHAQRKGRFERAHGGTLLLDEITETGPRLQAELLRVLEQQDFERVGGTEVISVNVRIISTTNRDLGRLVRDGGFRPDLYYRLGGVRITVPPLRERREDLPALVWHFVNQFAREVNRSVEQLDPEMMETFRRFDWPGNVRQLRNVVRTALIVGEGPVLSLAQAPWLRSEMELTPDASRAESLRLRDVERRAIYKALRITSRHQANAARLLGITDRTLREKLRRYRQEGHTDPVGEEQWLKAPA